MSFDEMDHEFFMREALKEAEAAFQRGDLPIGAVVVHEGRIIGRGANSRVSDGHRLAHAELKALTSCCRLLDELGSRVQDCVIYTTVEPCPMCLGAIIMANVRHIIFGTADPNAGGGPIVERVDYVRARVHDYVGGVLEDESRRLCEAFRTALAAV